MGYDVTRFVDKIDDNFLCLICTTVLENPVQSPCEHIFCNDCIITWLTVKNTCPADQCLLRVEDLKSVPRYFRNILDKMEIRCEFESHGCKTILTLEHAKDHLTKCTYNQNAEIICDKGCNMIITRHEYEKNSCITHLIHEVSRQQDQITRLTKVESEEICRQGEKIVKLNDELNRLRRQLLQYEIAIISQQKDNSTQIDIFKPPRFRWQVLKNVKISIDQPNVLASDGSYHAFAQSFSSLVVTRDSYFKIRILDGVEHNIITIGLTLKGHPYNVAPGNSEDSIGYNSNGNLWLNKTSNKVGKKWERGDVIRCGIKISNNDITDNDDNKHLTAEVDFSRNEECVIKTIIELPSEGLLTLFPTVYMYRNFYSSGFPKVEYLN